MKKSLVLTAMAGALGVSSLQAQQIDIYVTGATAFRTSAFSAVSNMFGSAFVEQNHGSKAVSSGNNQWTMKGQINSLYGARDVVVHASFNGSVQGIHGIFDPTDKSIFLAKSTSGDLTTVTNTVTIAFSDVNSAATDYPLTDAIERAVAVQPFVYARSLNCPASVTNVTIQQLQTVMGNGRVPLSYLSGNPADTSKLYLLNRTKDSGTRVSAFADAMTTGLSPSIYYWSTNAGVMSYTLATFAQPGAGIFGYGYVGGGDVTTRMNIVDANNVAIAYLGLSDAKNVNGGQNIIAYNGNYPSSDMALGVAVPNHPVFDRVINGQYSYWSYEVLIQPNTVPASGQDINSTELTSFCRMLASYDVDENFVGDTTGSIDQDIKVQQNTPASKVVAIRLGDMKVSRQAVGGAIAP